MVLVHTELSTSCPGELGKFPDVVMKIARAKKIVKDLQTTIPPWMQQSQTSTRTSSDRSESKANKPGQKVEQKWKNWS